VLIDDERFNTNPDLTVKLAPLAAVAGLGFFAFKTVKSWGLTYD
jgi:hypothetical protein